MSVGMAIVRPMAVVNNAIAIPLANCCGFPMAFDFAMSLKEMIMPMTVPSRPINGETVATPLRTRKCFRSWLT